MVELKEITGKLIELLRERRTGSLRDKKIFIISANFRFSIPHVWCTFCSSNYGLAVTNFY